jgi:predicted nuclease of restriction endonuclease-like RecB superfamily
MLTSEHAIVEFERGRAIPDRLVTGEHRHYLQYAQRVLDIYRNGSGRQRRDLHRQVEAVFADERDCPLRRIEAFCKLLDDKSVYQTDPRGQAAKLRLKVFSLAAPLHPLVTMPDRLFEHAEAQSKAKIAEELGMSWPDIEAGLYADVMAFQPLVSFEGYPDGPALLSRYNVAQIQACLYRAVSMTVEAAADFKTILRYAKLARLLHEIRPLGPSRYRITFSGPASILRETRSYGVNFARFLPALLACKDWRMSAIIQTPWKTKARLELSDRDGFKSHLPPPEEFDSTVEEAFATKFGPERDGWRLIREGEVLHRGQSAFVPDFVFKHEDGTVVLMEIVGFWTPEYLAGKRQTLRQFHQHRILIALPERSVRDGAACGDNVILYKTALKLQPVLEALERWRVTAGASTSRPSG